MKLVVFAAVPLAVLSPLLRDSNRVFASILFCGVIAPLVWVGLSFVLVRPGPIRERAVFLLLLLSVSTALVPATWFLWVLGNQALVFPPPNVDPQETWRMLYQVIAATATLAVAWVALLFLLAKAMRRTCDAASGSIPETH